MGCVRVLVACVAALALGRALPAESVWKVEMTATLRFPEEASSPDGAAVEPVRGLSGLTWLGGDRWVAVMDNSDRLVRFALDMSPQAEPTAIRDVRLVPLGARHDYEDVAVCPPALAARLGGPSASQSAVAMDPDGGMHLLVCEEDTPAIRLVRLADGRLVGELPLPDVFRRPRPNRGLEALAVDRERGHVWTANEEALPADGPPAAPGTGTVVRLLRLPVSPAERPLQLAYAVDPPHAFARLIAGPVLSGVVALVPLPDGRLLVLERSGGPGLPPFENRIYEVEPAQAPDVSDRDRDLATAPAVHAGKVLLWRGSLGCNLEGLGLGPPAANGSRSLVAISDNDGVGGPAVVAGFRLTSPSPCSTR